VNLNTFLTNLFECGRVVAPPPVESFTQQELALARQVLADRAASVALGFPSQAPPVDTDVALWAAGEFYRASQLAVYREVDAEAIAKLLESPCPPAPPAIRHWSVDLTFAFLPDLMLLARSASEHDPLVSCLARWAKAWPLSSVGIRGVTPENIEGVLDHPGLAQLYMDRILAKKDWPRVSDARTADVLRRTIGNYPTLWPQAAKILQSLPATDAQNGSPPS
jgi:hypothetical protein